MKIDEIEKDKIEKFFKEYPYKTYKEGAEYFNIPYYKIRQVVRERDIDRRDLLCKKVVKYKLNNPGKTNKEIADKFNIHRTTVNEYFKRMTEEVV